MELTLRRLNGDCSKIRDLNADAPIETLRARLERPLPRFHRIALFVGERSLRGGTLGEAGLDHGAEVKVVITKSHEEAIMAIEMLGTREDLNKEAMAAVQFLDQEVLESAQSELFWCVIRTAGFRFPDDSLLRVIKTFIHSCSEPAAFIPRLLVLWNLCYPISHAMPIAFQEIAAKLNYAIGEHRARVVAKVKESFVQCHGPCGITPLFESSIIASCSLLGKFGDATAKDTLNAVAAWQSASAGVVAAVRLAHDEIDRRHHNDQAAAHENGGAPCRPRRGRATPTLRPKQNGSKRKTN